MLRAKRIDSHANKKALWRSESPQGFDCVPGFGLSMMDSIKAEKESASAGGVPLAESSKTKKAWGNPPQASSNPIDVFLGNIYRGFKSWLTPLSNSNPSWIDNHQTPSKVCLCKLPNRGHPYERSLTFLTESIYFVHHPHPEGHDHGYLSLRYRNLSELYLSCQFTALISSLERGFAASSSTASISSGVRNVWNRRSA